MPDLAEPVLASIAGYYRRVTTDASPIGRLIGAVMLATIVALFGELLRGDRPVWLSLASLALVATPVALASLRVVPNAMRLGARHDPPAEQSRLARAICRDHLLCLARSRRSWRSGSAADSPAGQLGRLQAEQYCFADAHQGLLVRPALPGSTVRR